MKKRILLSIVFFAVLLCGSTSVTGQPIYTNITASGEVDTVYCSVCPDADRGADQLCEIPDGSADGLCGWTVDETGGATGEVNLADACDDSPTLGCTDIPMTYCASFVKTNTTSGNMTAYKTSTALDQYVQFYVKILAEGLADTNSFILFMFGVSGDYTSGCARILLYQSSGVLKLGMQYHVAAGWSTIDVGGTTISLDTWYGIRVYIHDPAGGGSDSIQWWVDYSNDGTWTNEGAVGSLTFDRILGYANFGYTNITYTISYMVTGLKIDDDTMPSSCVR